MKKLSFICLIIANTVTGTAQIIGNYGSDDLTEFLNPVQSNGLFFRSTKSTQLIEGTQYLFQDLGEKFEVYSFENKKYVVENLNYNIKSKTIELKIGNDSVFQFNSNKIDFIKNSSGRQKFYNINGENQLCKELYVLNKIFFLKGYSLVLVKEVINPMTDAVIVNARYDKKEKYFCKIGDNEIVEFDLKKKQILKLFGDKSKQVEDFIVNSKLIFTSENDLVQIFQFYDTL